MGESSGEDSSDSESEAANNGTARDEVNFLFIQFNVKDCIVLLLYIYIALLAEAVLMNEC